MSHVPFDLNSLRNTPLDPLLDRLGAEPDPKDKHNWRTPVGRMTVTGLKFFNHDEEVGGGGAIDLVMHILKSTFGRRSGSWAGFQRFQDDCRPFFLPGLRGPGVLSPFRFRKTGSTSGTI